MDLTPQWTNWAGNQSCNPASLLEPDSESAVALAIKTAAGSGSTVRAVAAGHSFTDVCTTDGVVLNMRGLRGILDIDASTRRMTLLAGTPITDVGDPLWERGLSLANQGDIDVQFVAGAVATATHGSGTALRNMSAMVRTARLVLASGETLLVNDSTPELLKAAQVSLGMLGVMVELTLEVVPAFKLRERVEHWSMPELLERWDVSFDEYHHFSFYWCPTRNADQFYGLNCPQSIDMAGMSHVKMFRLVDIDTPDDLQSVGRRTGRPYRLYPSFAIPNFHELEYMVGLENGIAAFAAVRDVFARFPDDGVYPVEVRSTAADDAYLSPNHGRPSLVISVSGRPGTRYEPFLRAVHAALAPFDARPHWGKLHFFDREQLNDVLPRFADFVDVRRRLDPDRVFLNASLRALFE